MIYVYVCSAFLLFALASALFAYCACIVSASDSSEYVAEQSDV